MSVSSISSYSSTLWEEYLEELQKKQQQRKESAVSSTSAGTAASAVSSALTPDGILSELQELQDDPEQLKARASELAVQVAKEAESSAGIRSNALNELVADLEEVADSGDLSVIREKLASGSGAAGPKGPPPGGMGGASGVSSKLLEALIEEEDDEDDESDSYVYDIKAFLDEIRELTAKEDGKTSYIGFDDLVSRFQAIKETNAADVSDETGGAAAKDRTSADFLISKIKTGLSDQLRALYTQRQTQSSTVSLSG
jgi:hypothetical protein